jgi:hypothetical protein
MAAQFLLRAPNTRHKPRAVCLRNPSNTPEKEGEQKSTEMTSKCCKCLGYVCDRVNKTARHWSALLRWCHVHAYAYVYTCVWKHLQQVPPLRQVFHVRCSYYHFRNTCGRCEHPNSSFACEDEALRRLAGSGWLKEEQVCTVGNCGLWYVEQPRKLLN